MGDGFGEFIGYFFVPMGSSFKISTLHYFTLLIEGFCGHQIAGLDLALILSMIYTTSCLSSILVYQANYIYIV